MVKRSARRTRRTHNPALKAQVAAHPRNRVDSSPDLFEQLINIPIE
jgi:hypothetical protein